MAALSKDILTQRTQAQEICPSKSAHFPKEDYFVELSVIFILNNLCSDLRSVDFAPSNVPTIDSGNCACAREVNKRRKRTR
jgi:hypothetical protein